MITWYGNATIKIQSQKTSILFDPYIIKSFDENSDISLKNLQEYFGDIDSIMITHGHFDHFMDVSEFVKKEYCSPGESKESGVEFYCTKTSYETLTILDNEELFENKKLHEYKESIYQIEPNTKLRIGDIDVSIKKSKHIQFDYKMYFQALKLLVTQFHKKAFRRLLKEAVKYKENKETVMYELNFDGYHVQLLGSCNLDDDTEYLTGADLLILPLQGRSDICTYAVSIVDRLKPKAILIDHHDDAFPPLTKNIPVDKFVQKLKIRYPKIKVIIPGKTVNYTNKDWS